MSDETSWLIEIPGPMYLAAKNRSFCWSGIDCALRLYSLHQANNVLDSARALVPDLFRGITGNPRAVEHMWISRNESPAPSPNKRVTPPSAGQEGA